MQPVEADALCSRECNEARWASAERNYLPCPLPRGRISALRYGWWSRWGQPLNRSPLDHWQRPYLTDAEDQVVVVISELNVPGLVTPRCSIEAFTCITASATYRLL